jgi:xylulokinase
LAYVFRGTIRDKENIMPYTMGIDLGTSSLKAVIVDIDGNIKAMGQKSYQLKCPRPGWVEQDTETWWRSCREAVAEALAGLGEPSSEIKAVSFSGQMHGLVPIGHNGNVLRPAIIHCDARTTKEVMEIKDRFAGLKPKGSEFNPVFTGFLLPSLLWMRENEKALYEKTAFVFLPKDFLKYKLCSEINTDYSDAAGTLLYDIEANQWSKDICSIFDIPPGLLPPCFDSTTPVGQITGRAAAETGLREGTLVVSGGADQVMQAIGNGTILPGQAIVNIGSSGEVCFQSGRPIRNSLLNTNTFSAYKQGAWYTMGATMAAGLSFKWFNNLFDSADYAAADTQIAQVPAGSGGLIFFPYLNGERTPHVNPVLSSAFFGMNYNTGRPQMARAVMEGVTYSLAQCAELCESLDLRAEEFVASGGGAQSPVWLQMISDVFGKPIKVSARKEQAAVGAAAAAAVGAGFFPSIEAACAAQARYEDTVWTPSWENHAVYSKYFHIFKDMFAACSKELQRLTEMGRMSPSVP